MALIPSDVLRDLIIVPWVFQHHHDFGYSKRVHDDDFISSPLHRGLIARLVCKKWKSWIDSFRFFWLHIVTFHHPDEWNLLDHLQLRDAAIEKAKLIFISTVSRRRANAAKDVSSFKARAINRQQRIKELTLELSVLQEDTRNASNDVNKFTVLLKRAGVKRLKMTKL